jgi:hypothetical protein
VNPLLDYDFGPNLVANDLRGALSLLPVIRHDSHGRAAREQRWQRTSGVPSVLHQAPPPISGGMSSSGSSPVRVRLQRRLRPAKTPAERAKNADPRPSVEERYGTLDGYVCVVERAAAQAVKDRFLVQEDADRLMTQVRSSDVLPHEADSSEVDRATARNLCRGPQK